MALVATTYREHAPHPALRAHVRVLWTLAGPCDDPAPQTLLPDGAMSLWLNFGDAIAGAGHDVATGSAALLGEVRRPLEVASAGVLDIVGVTFWPGHARAFVDASLAELADRLVVTPPLLASLNDVVDAAPGDRIARLQHVLLRALRPARAPSALMRHAFSRLDHDDAPDIAALARDAGLSTRQLERRFADELGTSPKQMASVLRFRRALAAMQVDAPDFVDIAYRCGYADQAHLIRDFARYTGAPPKRFVDVDAPRTRREWLARPGRVA
ncbi:MAG TPA: helix-turn-helix transcriptional regulator [Myxococcota bacterium]